jgi:hypothetical protein
VLSLVVVLPAAVLFLLDWQSLGDRASFATDEHHGIQYLQALGPVEIALTNAETAAISGQTVPKSALTQAVDAAGQVDKRLGDDLRTHDRWTELSAKIEALPTTADPAHLNDTYSAYGQTTDLLLALYDKVRDESKLIRDPNADTYYLEDGAAQELPEGVVAAAQYTNLAVIAVATHSTAANADIADLTSARAALASNAQDLSDDVRLAVDGTDNKSLGGSLLTLLDQFNRSVDALIPSTSLLQGKTLAVDPAQVTRAQSTAQSAAAALSAALLAQIDQLLIGRADSLNHQRDLALGLFVLVVLLAIAPMLLAVFGRRGGSGGGSGPTTGQTSWRGAAAPGERSGPQANAPPVPAGAGAGNGTGGQLTPVWMDAANDRLPGTGYPVQAGEDPELMRWERFGASR